MASAHYEFLHNPPGSGNHCHAPTLVRLSNGGLLAAWYAYPEEETRAARLVLSHKEAMSRAWGAARIILEPDNSSLGNPVLYQSDDGTLWLYFVDLKGPYWNDAQLYAARSSDNGLTWSVPARLWPARGVVVRHPPVLCRDRSLILPAYDEVAHETILLASRAPYADWCEAYRFSGVPIIQPSLIRLDESLVLFFRPWGDPRRIWRSFSTDEGRKWSAPVRTPLPNPLTALAAFTVGRHIALAYNHTEEHRRYPLSLALSKDAGITWSAPYHIDESPFEVSYPSFVSAADGRVLGVYTYNRRMIKFVSISTDLFNSEA